ncbi:hypothetical protein N7540_006778 [Penicillium herquei]|nr:hypothetical protein N7540_006778 [Penicillium herquei]
MTVLDAKNGRLSTRNLSRGAGSSPPGVQHPSLFCTHPAPLVIILPPWSLALVPKPFPPILPETKRRRKWLPSAVPPRSPLFSPFPTGRL